MLMDGNSANLTRYPNNMPNNHNLYNQHQAGGYAAYNSGRNMGSAQHHMHMQPLIKVRFEKLAFYDFQAELNVPIKLTAMHPYAKPATTSFQFALTNENINQISLNRTTGSIQVHLRFGYYDGQNVQKDVIPPNLILNVNQKPAVLPTPKPTSKPGSDVIRPGRSIDITPQIKMVPNSLNKVEMSWTDEKVNL